MSASFLGLTFLEQRNLNNFPNLIEGKPNKIIKINHTIFNCSTQGEKNNTRRTVTLTRRKDSSQVCHLKTNPLHPSPPWVVNS